MLRAKRGQAVGLLPWRLATAGIALICIRAFYEADFVLLSGEILLLYGAKRLLV